MAPMQRQGSSEPDNKVSKRRVQSDDIEEGEPPLKRPAKAANEESGDEDPGKLSDADRRLEAKRAYNRVNAARARQRVKDQLADFGQKVETLSDKNAKLERANDDLVKRVAALTEENQMLRRILLNRNDGGAAGSGGAMMGLQGMSGGLPLQSHAQAFQHPLMQQLAGGAFGGVGGLGASQQSLLASYQQLSGGGASAQQGQDNLAQQLMLVQEQQRRQMLGAGLPPEMLARQQQQQQQGQQAADPGQPSAESLLASHLLRGENQGVSMDLSGGSGSQQQNALIASLLGRSSDPSTDSSDRRKM